MESNKLKTACNTTGKHDSEKHMVMVLITILSSEKSSPFCQFLDGCYCTPKDPTSGSRGCGKNKADRPKSLASNSVGHCFSLSAHQTLVPLKCSKMRKKQSVTDRWKDGQMDGRTNQHGDF